MRPHEMNVGEAILDLGRNGCSQDPIWFYGEEMTPDTLEDRLFTLDMAKDVRIDYWGGLHLCRKVLGGTLSGLVGDRRRLTKSGKPDPKVTVDVTSDPSMNLVGWLHLIVGLIETHGSEAVMYTDGGHNNVDLRLEKSE